MDATPDRRDAPRVPLRLLVQYRVDTVDDFYATHATNLSVGGMFIRGATDHVPGELLYFQFRLTDGTSLIEGLGRVAHVNPDGPDSPGMGIEFVNLDEDSLDFIDSVIARRLGAAETG